MKRFINMLSAIVLFSTLCCVHAKEPAKRQEPLDHTQWIASVIKDAEVITPGMTRERLLQTFTTEGGISTPTQRTYVYRACPYIKVDVVFELAPQNLRGRFQEQDEDKIITISRPYLQLSISD